MPRLHATRACHLMVPLPSPEQAHMHLSAPLPQRLARPAADSYLHSRCIVHGDLNARNVLVASSAASPIKVAAKLADLGLSRCIKQHGTHHTTCTVRLLARGGPMGRQHTHKAHHDMRARTHACMHACACVAAWAGRWPPCASGAHACVLGVVASTPLAAHRLARCLRCRPSCSSRGG